MRHAAPGIGSVLDGQGTGRRAAGAPLGQQVLAGGTATFHADNRDNVARLVPALFAEAERIAIAAVRAHARASAQLDEATWRGIRCAVTAPPRDARDDRILVLVRVAVDGIARRSLGSDALAGAAAALTHLAAVDDDASIEDLRVYAAEVDGRPRRLHPAGLPPDVAARLPPAVLPLARTRCAVLTLSDRASQGIYEDRSGARLAEIIEAAGGTLAHRAILPDDAERLHTAVDLLSRRGDIDLLFCTGGTGIGPRDITPDTLLALGVRPIPGIGELLRAHSAPIVRAAWLSRSVAGKLGSTVVIALPGSTNAVVESMEALLPLLPHLLSMLHGGNHEGDHHAPPPGHR